MNDNLKLYILDGERIRLTCDIHQWSEFFRDSEKRIIGKTCYGKICVSTVFLGVDLNILGKSPPILFETMIFNCPLFENYQKRSCTYEEAQTTHKQACNAIENYLQSIQTKETPQ